MTRKPAKRGSSNLDPFPRIFIEALAYHESGHAVMAVLLGVPVVRIVIGPACDDPDFNAKVELDWSAAGSNLSVENVVLVQVASEPAEKLAPNHTLFATMHKTHRHLQPFGRGVQIDLTRGLNVVAARVYQLMGLSESTARQYFKRQYRDKAHRLFEVPVLRCAFPHSGRIFGRILPNYHPKW
jgi:hypothetical protein